MKDVVFVYYIYLVDFIELWLVLWGIMHFSPVKKKLVYTIVGLLHCLLLLVMGIFYADNTGSVTIFSTLLLITSICFLFQGSFFKKFKYSLLCYVLILLWDACTYNVVDLSGHEFSNGNLPRIILNTATISILGIIVFIRKKIKRTYVQVHISRRIYALLFSGAGTGALVLAALLVGSNDKVTESARKALVVIVIIVVISYCAACLMMIVVSESRDNYKVLSQINQNVIEAQQEYYILVNDKQQEMRSIRHEMKNHLSCIHGLYKANKLIEMEHYLEDIIEASNVAIDLFDTGNDIVNAILNDAQSKYKNNNIMIRLEGGFPKNLEVASMDLCVIFANIISNAIEAILKIERKESDIYYVDVRISSFKDDLFIDIKNPTNNIAEEVNGNLITSKNDKSLHGFGIKNVIHRVEKYQGSINYKYENHFFYVEINIKNRVKL